MARKINSAGSPSRLRQTIKAGNQRYFAGEVVRILNLQSLDYDQLHQLFDLVRGAPRRVGDARKWRRFTFTEVASLRVAARLVGVGDRRVPRLRIRQLKEACNHLRSELGIRNPLLESRMRMVGGALVVELDGRHFDAATMQRLFDVVGRDVARYDRRHSLSLSTRISVRGSNKKLALEVSALALTRRK